MSAQTPPPFKSPYGPPGVPVDTRKLIHFATDGVQPPSSVYLDVNDQLLAQVFSTDTAPVIQMRYRILNPGGEIIQGQENFAYTVAQRNAQNFLVNLMEGFLLSLVVGIQTPGPSALSRGQTRVRVFLLRGSFTQTFLSQELVNGLVDLESALTWPGGLLEPTNSGMGFIRSVTGTTPAAGAEITEFVPASARFGFRTFRFQLTTSATVATRGVALLIDDGVNTLFAIEAPSTQAASLVQQYNYGAIGARADKVFGTNISIPFPNITLAQNWRIRTLTTALQAGDQYTAPQYCVEDWLGG